jgi:flagellar hook-associated protein 2
VPGKLLLTLSVSHADEHGMSSSTITPIIMNLTGQYATDFQSILNKAVQTSQVPLTQLQTKDSEVLAAKATLGSLQSTVAALTSSLSALGADGSSLALSATSSNNAAVTASNSGATSPANYTINSVASVASAASETSLNSYVDSASTPITTGTTTPGEMQLVVGSKTYNFALTNNNLTGLMNQINGLNSGVTASILTTSGGNYLSLQANSTGATTLQLNDESGVTPTNIISTTNQGTDAEFFLNGIDIKQASNTVNNVIPGLTFNIVGKTSTPTTLTLASNPSQLSNDLQTFVSNYNNVQAAVKAQVGTTGGALIGTAVINQLQQTMQHLISHFSSSTGGVQGLSDLGVTFNGIDGALTFDPSVVGGMSSSQITNSLNFLGSTTTGLGAFSQSFDQFSNPVTGMIQTQINSETASDVELQKHIASTTNQINAMQQNLAKQIEASDVLESMYESQQTELTASLQGLNLVLYGKAAGSPG